MAKGDADWLLFSDWCASWDLLPLPTTADVVSRFLAAFPAGLGTQGRRVRAIRVEHERQGAPLELPSAYSPRARLWKEQAGLDVGPALAQLPKFRPPGLRGRRDAYLLVLAGSLGFTREQCRAVRPDQITVTPSGVIHIAGSRVPFHEEPRQCPSCAVTRWLRVAGPSWRGNTAARNAILDATRADLDEHDCLEPLVLPVSPGQQRVRPDYEDAEWLLLSYDRHRWVNLDGPLSIRAITTILQRVRIQTDWVEEVGVVEREPSRYADLSQQELYDEQDALDRRVAEALLRSQELYADATRLDLDLHDAATDRRAS